MNDDTLYDEHDPRSDHYKAQQAAVDDKRRFTQLDDDIRHAPHPDFANNTFTPPPPFTPLNLRSTQDAKLVAAALWIYNHPGDEDGVKRSAAYILEQLIGDAA